MSFPRFTQSLLAATALASLLTGARGCDDDPPMLPEADSGTPETDAGRPETDAGAPTDCVIGGCSGTLCSDEEPLASTCEWLPEYACYRDATCERQADGQCGWTQTDALRVCLDEGGPKPEQPCHVGGCSGQVCSDDPGATTTCEWREEYACYRDAACERQTDGECGWTETDTLRECLDAGGPTPEPAPDPCFVGGCSGQVCSAENDIVTTCEWREEYACYRDATCERQSDGECGWTETDALRACIDAGGPPPALPPCQVGGCSGQLCTDDPGLGSTCEFLPEYLCYRDATCARQADGQCGWTETDALRECIDTSR